MVSTVGEPFFSICIPQYNRTSFVKKAIETFKDQGFKDFEVCISDGCSNDGRHLELEEFLRGTGLAYQFRRSETNLRYDPNTRAAIGLAKGKYVILMGNDDALNGPDALQRLRDDIEAYRFPGVVISDFCDDRTSERAFRIRQFSDAGAGPEVAATHFRNFSFVSGLTMNRALCHQFASDKWDGSEMYQTYVGCQILASGQSLLERDHQLVRKDIFIEGESVDSYAARPRVSPCPILERQLPLGQLGRVVADAIRNYAGTQQERLNERILQQLIGFTYPYWLFEYRRVQSWKYSAGIALGMRPARCAEGVELGWWRRLKLHLLYTGVTVGGLLIPLSVWNRIHSTLYRIAKSK